MTTAPPRRHRPHNRNTVMGDEMAVRSITIKQLERDTGVSHRTMSDYLANRIPIKSHHKPILSDYLDIHPDDLQEPVGDPSP